MLIIIKIAILLSYFILGAYATTDILRLLKGSTLPIYSGDCYCPICNNKIRLVDQIPIISYAHSKGKCYHCKSQIPISNLIFEIIIFISFTSITILMHFSWWAYLADLLLYETIKIISIIKCGARETDFIINLMKSLILNVFLFLLIAALFFMKNIVIIYTQ